MAVFLGALLIIHAQHSLQAVYPLEHCFKHQDFLLITPQVDMRDTITTNTQKRNHTLHNLIPPSVRLMRVSYVISLNVVEKFWTPTHRHSYTTVNSVHTERLANQHAAGSYL